MAVDGNCSRRRHTTFRAKSLSWANFAEASCPDGSPRKETLRKKAGISEALALMTLGRTTSFGIFPIAMSIFSFTSMKSMSMLAPGSNFNKIFPTSIRESELMLFTPDTCASCPLRGAITRFSISCAEQPGILSCTVICGMSMSGISDTGMFLMPTMPITTRAISIIVTATGR